MFLILFITCLDGSQVNLKVKDDVVFDLNMKYGALKIPIKELRFIEVGIHVDNPKDYENAVRSLGKDKYGDRDAGTRFLKANLRGAWRYIQALQQDKDPEVAKRVELIIREMSDRPPILDALTMDKSYLAGDLQLTEIEGVNDSLGQLKIKLSQIVRIVIKPEIHSIEVDSASNKWVEIGHVYDGKLTIVATGTVDLFPTTPGSYTCSPNGYSSLSRDSTFQAGSLIGRDANGKEFTIGERFSSSSFPRGKVEARIAASPWQNASTGKYQLTIE